MSVRSPRRTRIGLVLALGLVLGTSAPAPSAPASSPAGGEGPAIGTAAPRFALRDQTGTTRTLDSLLERGKLAIVFYRSADW